MNRPDPNIDELLNGLIDGELSADQRMEVQRLITQDEQAAKRLRQLQKVKMLVSSLPHVKAPEGIAESVLDGLQEQPVYSKHQEVPQFKFGKVLAVAATIALVAVLSAVIYTLFAPQAPQESATRVATIETKPSITLAAGFSGRLELKTGTFTTVDAFINRAVRDNDLSDCIKKTSEQNKNLYSISCSRDDLNLLLSDLQSIWQRFDSATLLVDTEQFDKPVVVNTVTAEQAAEVINQKSLKKSVEVAKDFAVLNNMAEVTPGKQVLTAINDRGVNLITIPKPALTGDQKAVKKTTTSQPKDKQIVSLTIVVEGRE